MAGFLATGGISRPKFLRNDFFSVKYNILGVNYRPPDFEFSPLLKIWSGSIFGVLFVCLYVGCTPSPVGPSVGRSVGRSVCQSVGQEI